jgi:thiamine biosynthesis lipoprotein ApbE
VTRVKLADRGLSTSGVSDRGDVIDPRTGEPLTGTRSCTAIARTAFDAEVWSTAGLILGRAGVVNIAGESRDVVDRILWIEACHEGPATVHAVDVTH